LLPTDPSQSETAESAKPRGLRARAVVLSFLLAIPVCYATTNQGASAIFSLIAAPVGLLIVLVLLNAPLRKFVPKLALSQADLILIFSLTAVAAAVGTEWSNVTHPAIREFPFQAAEGNNVAKDYALKFLPDWLIIPTKAPIEDMAGGGKGVGYVLSKMPEFFPRYLGWGGLFFAVCLGMLCINSLMRGAWCRQERLTFPLIQLPVAMSENGGTGGIWRSKHMWIAFAIMFGIDMLNGLNYLYPNVPSIPTKEFINLGTLFNEEPMRSIGSVPIAIYPFMAAIGLFMPSDMIFSVVFFFLLRKLTHVIVASQGMPQGTMSGTFIAPGPPYFDEQTWGGVLAMFIAAMWFAKGYLKDVWRQILVGTKADDGGVKHRWAFVGLLVCTLVVMWYGMIGGLPAWYMFVYVSLFFIFSIVLTRIRAQIGPPTHEFAFFGPNSFMNRFFGTKWLDNRQATWVSHVFLFINRIHRTHPMPYQLEAMKMGSLNRMNQRSLFLSIAAITVFAFFVSFFFLDVLVYRTGRYGNWNAGEVYLHNIIDNKTGPNLVGITMTLFGFAMVMMMDTIRFKLPGFPLHPAGYVLSLNFGVDYYWFGLLLALIVKGFVQRYYGLKGYDKLRGIAIGILIGEYAAELIWMSMALITHNSTYTISFNDRGLGTQ
jgi:hypothetical protein